MRAFGFELFVVVLVAPASQSSAQAQSDTLVPSPSTLEIFEESQAASRMAQLERGYERADLKRPRAGVAVSAILIVGGASAIAISETSRGFIVVGGDAPGSNAFTTIGSAMLVASTIGLVVASRRLKKKKAERRRLEQQMAALELSRSPP